MHIDLINDNIGSYTAAFKQTLFKRKSIVFVTFKQKQTHTRIGWKAETVFIRQN